MRYPYIVLLTFLRISNIYANGLNEKNPILEFQMDGVINDESAKTHAIIEDLKFTSNKDFSICFWFKFAYKRARSSIFSYCWLYGQNEKGCTHLEFVGDDLVLSFLSKVVNINVVGKIRDWTWNHFCGIYKKKEEKKFSVQIYLNGAMISNKAIESNIKWVIGTKSRLTFGQKDEFYTEYDKFTSFSGEITLIESFSYELTVDRIRPHALCSSALNGNWMNYLELLQGVTNVGKTRSLPLSDICPSSDELFYFSFPEKRTFSSAVALCDRFGGKVSIPYANVDNVLLTAKSFPLRNFCETINTPKGAFWLGMKFEKDKWIDVSTGGAVSFFLWDSEIIPNNCAFVEMTDNALLLTSGVSWKSAYCFKPGSLKLCTTCEFSRKRNNLVTVRLGGLCEESTLDRDFVIAAPVPNLKIQFNGLSYSRITWVNSSSEWVLSSELFSERASFEDERTAMEYPIGRKLWNIENVSCKNQKKGSKAMMTLSTCSDDQYTCDNGNCVHLNKRCDKILDCEDESDEKDCSIIEIPDEYKSWVIPATRQQVNEKLRLQVGVSIHIMSVESFTDSDFCMKFQMNITWYDFRLKFLNLKEGDMSLNTVGISKVLKKGSSNIWIPQIVFPTGFKSHMETIEGIMVERVSDPVKEINRVQEALVYSGEKNPISLLKTVKGHFYCDFEYTYFPFEQQWCEILLTLKSSTANEIRLLDKYARFFDPQLTSDYSVKSIEFMKINKTTMFSHLKLRLFLVRRWQYTFFSCYLTSFVFGVIAYLTLWIDIEDFHARLFGSIGILILLFFSRLCCNGIIPSTLYLKIIDYWTLFFAFTTTMIIILHILINWFYKDDIKIDVMNRKINVKTANPIYFSPVEAHTASKSTGPVNVSKVIIPEQNKTLATKVNHIFKILFALFYIIFILINALILVSYYIKL